MRLQEQPVRQPGQVIVIGELVEALLVGEQLALRLLALRQVAHQVGHQAPVARLDRHAAHFDVDLPAVLEPLHQLDAAARFDARQRRDHRILRIVRTAQHRQHRAAAQFLEREAQLLLHGRIGIDDLAGARVGDQQAVLRLLDDGAIARLERQAVGIETARARHQQHGDDGEAADQQAEQDGLVERGARRLRERAARNLQLHQPHRRAHLVAQDEIAIDVRAARDARQQVRSQRRAAAPSRARRPARRRVPGSRPDNRSPARAKSDPCDRPRVGVKARANAIQPCGWPVPEPSKIGPHREQRRSARALHDAAHAVVDRTQLTRGHALLERRQQIRIGRDLVLLGGGRHRWPARRGFPDCGRAPGRCRRRGAPARRRSTTG